MLLHGKGMVNGRTIKKIMAFLLDARLQDGRVVYVAEVLVVIQYNVLVARHGYTRSVVV